MRYIGEDDELDAELDRLDLISEDEMTVADYQKYQRDWERRIEAERRAAKEQRGIKEKEDKKTIRHFAILLLFIAAIPAFIYGLIQGGSILLSLFCSIGMYLLFWFIALFFIDSSF